MAELEPREPAVILPPAPLAYSRAVQSRAELSAGPVSYAWPADPRPGPLHASADPLWRLWVGRVALVARLVVLLSVCLPASALGFGMFLLIRDWFL